MCNKCKALAATLTFNSFSRLYFYFNNLIIGFLIKHFVRAEAVGTVQPTNIRSGYGSSSSVSDFIKSVHMYPSLLRRNTLLELFVGSTWLDEIEIIVQLILEKVRSVYVLAFSDTFHVDVADLFVKFHGLPLIAKQVNFWVKWDKFLVQLTSLLHEKKKVIQE
jgi:hypothetical protein